MDKVRNKPKNYYPNIGNVVTLVTTIIAISLAAGQGNARINEAFTRIEKLEERMLPSLDAIRRDINNIKIQVAETARDVDWIKENAEKSEKN